MCQRLLTSWQIGRRETGRDRQPIMILKIMSLARLYLLKFPPPPNIVPPAGGQAF
jgi:hypothetical protein